MAISPCERSPDAARSLSFVIETQRQSTAIKAHHLFEFRLERGGLGDGLGSLLFLLALPN
jgi:hypothetical protein